MKKILIYKYIIEMGEYDLFNKTDYEKINCIIKNDYNNIVFNTGNKLWLQGIYTEIQNEENEYTFVNNSMTPEYINSKFDMVILPMANIFNENYIDSLNKMSDIFELINIPTYVIACGVQADSYSDLDKLIEKIEIPAKRFIDAIYNTGGEFALRGNFTKIFFDRIRENTAVVTGCPSLFQMGRNLKVTKEIVSKDVFKVLLNGNINIFKDNLNDDNSFFIDQTDFFEFLYNPIYIANKNYDTFCKKLIKKYDFKILEIILNKKVKLFFDMNVWYSYIKKEKFNFSFGSRIHGNIMPILCGVPSLVYAWDSRTREMAEFFHIPYIIDEQYENSTRYKDVYQLYKECDYTEFNEKFPELYDNFEKFLSDHHIVNNVNEVNSFLKIISTTDSDVLMPNEKIFGDIRNYLNRHKLKYKFINLYYVLFGLLKKIVKHFL